MRRIVLVILTILITSPIWAQEDKASLINNIKKENNLYLYGDVTLSTLDVAYEVALQELQANLAEWASNHSRKSVERTQITDLSTLADTIVMKRYNMYRVFAYVHKSKIMNVLNKNGFKIHDNLVTQKDPYSKNKMNQQKDLTQRKEPSKETIKKPEPIEPIRQKTDTIPQPVVKPDSTKSSLGLIDIIPDRLINDKSGKEMKIDKTKDKSVTEKEKVKKWQEDMTKKPFVMPKKEKAPVTIPESHLRVLEKILSAKDFFDLEGIMMPMKKSGKITQMGRFSSGMDVSDCYLVVFDTDGNIRALLSPGKDNRLNIGTHETDHTSNYKNCGAIWFKIQ